jgi:hypothetical protein
VETDRDGAEATAAFTAEWVPEREVPAWEAMETGPPKAQASDATAPETAVDDESASRWKVRPSPTQGPTPILAETPGWGLEMPPSTFSGRLPEPIPDIDAGQGQLGPSSTSVTRLAEPFGSLAGALPPSAREIPSPMAELPFGSVGGRFEPVPEGMMERTMERASNASPSQMPVGIAARVPTVSQRAGLPLLPGGTPPPVSTRPWSLAAAMQPIAPLAPTSARPGGAPAAEPARSVPSLTPTSGLNVPFPAVVAILVAVLLVIVVLILLDLHR